VDNLKLLVGGGVKMPPPGVFGYIRFIMRFITLDSFRVEVGTSELISRLFVFRLSILTFPAESDLKFSLV
jgi:hypothetical protein